MSADRPQGKKRSLLWFYICTVSVAVLLIAGYFAFRRPVKIWYYKSVLKMLGDAATNKGVVLGGTNARGIFMLTTWEAAGTDVGDIGAGTIFNNMRTRYPYHCHFRVHSRTERDLSLPWRLYNARTGKFAKDMDHGIPELWNVLPCKK